MSYPNIEYKEHGSRVKWMESEIRNQCLINNEKIEYDICCSAKNKATAICEMNELFMKSEYKPKFIGSGYIYFYNNIEQKSDLLIYFFQRVKKKSQ